MNKKHLLAALCVPLLLAGPGLADGHDELNVDFAGWARTEYGLGDRYPDRVGQDRFGVSKYAIATQGAYQKFLFVGVVGGTVFTDGSSEVISIRDAFIVWNDREDSGFEVSVGAQPLLFGLKPNGYPGDRSLQGSIEYGAGGAFAVSNQAGPSLRASYHFSESGKITVGLFDTGESAGTEGSNLAKNGFVQLSFDRLGVDGLYGVAGIEGRYEGTTDSTEPIIDVGLGFKQGNFDISAEVISLDKSITGTADDELYGVVELTFTPDNMLFSLDWGYADALEAQTIRAEFGYRLNPHVDWRVGYAGDFFDAGGDVTSVDTRLTFSY